MLLKHGKNDFGCAQTAKTVLNNGWDLLLLLIMVMSQLSSNYIKFRCSLMLPFFLCIKCLIFYIIYEIFPEIKHQKYKGQYNALCLLVEMQPV